MSLISSITSSKLTLPKPDHIGIAASVLCAIHCALAPFLLLALPTFGKIWAHPSSHILVALLVVPLAVLSIRKGYLIHQKRWVLVTAYIGIFVVLTGAVLPAFGKEVKAPNQSTNELATISESDSTFTFSVSDEESVGESTCDDESEDNTQCIDNCCPTVQVSETGESFLYIPPAAIVTTLGGIFLIVAHVGNICSCGHSCRTGKCDDC